MMTHQLTRDATTSMPDETWLSTSIWCDSDMCVRASLRGELQCIIDWLLVQPQTLNPKPCNASSTGC
jgi:hypothetical protein